MTDCPKCQMQDGYCICNARNTGEVFAIIGRWHRDNPPPNWMRPAGQSINHPHATDGISSRAARQEPTATT